MNLLPLGQQNPECVCTSALRAPEADRGSGCCSAGVTTGGSPQCQVPLQHLSGKENTLSKRRERWPCLSTVPCAVDHHEHNRKLQIQHLHSSCPAADGQNLAAPHGQEIRCPQALRACASHRQGEAKAPQVTANCAMGSPLSPTMP